MTGAQIGGSNAELELASLQRWAHQAPPIAVAEYRERIRRALEATERAGADALLVNAGPSLRYFTGVSWSPTERLVALLLPLRGEPALVCPTFELGSLEAELEVGARIVSWQEDDDPVRVLCDTLPANTLLAVDPLLPYGFAERLRARLRVQSAEGIIDPLRRVKSANELALMSQAKAMTLEVQRRAARILAPGIRASAVKRFIDAAHRALGASGSTFCAVQFGRATAFPHGLPGDQELAPDELVLIDTGCTVEGYHSDITRTYAFGAANAEVRSLWSLEKEAQAAAFDAVRVGAPCESVDATARAVLERGGLGPDYKLPGLPHRTGHGIGLAIHEPPYLVRGDRTPLQPGMCFSNEPMIVVPDRFGIRLEDHFHVTESGAAWFTEPQVAIDQPFD